MRIYVASSWRNTFQPAVVQALRGDGHAVYDFREPGSGWGEGSAGPGPFSWSEISESWMEWVGDIPMYLQALLHPRAEEGFRRDMDALERAQVCVMVHPAGVSAAMETGFACGAGKAVFVYVPGLREPDLMVKMAALITDKLDEIRNAIGSA